MSTASLQGPDGTSNLPVNLPPEVVPAAKIHQATETEVAQKILAPGQNSGSPHNKIYASLEPPETPIAGIAQDAGIVSSARAREEVVRHQAPAEVVARHISESVVVPAPTVPVAEGKKHEFTRVPKFEITMGDKIREGFSKLLRGAASILTLTLVNRLCGPDFLQENWKSTNRKLSEIQAKLIDTKIPLESSLKTHELYQQLTDKIGKLGEISFEPKKGWAVQTPGGLTTISESAAKELIRERASLVYLRAAFVLEHAKSPADYNLVLEDLAAYSQNSIIDANLFNPIDKKGHPYTTSNGHREETFAAPLMYLKGMAYLKKSDSYNAYECFVKSKERNISDPTSQAQVTEEMAKIESVVKAKAFATPELLSDKEVKILSHNEENLVEFLRHISDKFKENPSMTLSGPIARFKISGSLESTTEGLIWTLLRLKADIKGKKLTYLEIISSSSTLDLLKARTDKLAASPLKEALTQEITNSNEVLEIAKLDNTLMEFRKHIRVYRKGENITGFGFSRLTDEHGFLTMDVTLLSPFQSLQTSASVKKIMDDITRYKKKVLQEAFSPLKPLYEILEMVYKDKLANEGTNNQSKQKYYFIPERLTDGLGIR
jgi:hypothetical protein